MRWVTSTIIAIVLALGLTLSSAASEADGDDVPSQLRSAAPALLEDALRSITTSEGADEFNLDGSEGVRFGELHRVHRLADSPDGPRVAPIDEWLVPVFQDGTGRLRITLYQTESGEYAFAEAAASDDMSYLDVIEERRVSEKLVSLPVDSNYFLVDPATEQVRAVRDDPESTAITNLRELAALEADQLRPPDGKDSDVDSGSGASGGPTGSPAGLRAPAVQISVTAGLLIAAAAGMGWVIVRRRRGPASSSVSTTSGRN